MNDMRLDIADMLDGLPLGVAWISPDRRLIYINRAMESLTGYAGEESGGTQCASILRCSWCLRDCPLNGRGLDEKPVSLEGNIINRDRRLIPVRATVSALKDQFGRPAGFLETIEDLRGLGNRPESQVSGLRFANIVGRSPQLEQILDSLSFIAQTESSLFITGETGTGKDILAEAIHYASKRAKGPFVKVNCGALPETLLESELFGYRKGAFTGAMDNRPGRIQLAQNGTLFLTEIGDLTPPLQVKLLSFLDDKVIYPLGGGKAFQSNARIISATHHDLEELVAAGRFRKDLLFRLNVIRLHLPPLRERGADKRLLLDHFLRIFGNTLGKKLQGFSSAALDMLQAYDYPGNVRELRNILEYASTLARGDIIDSADLPPYVVNQDHHIPSSSPLPPPAAGPSPAWSWTTSPGMVDLEALERGQIMDALLKAGGRRGKAAQILGWARSTLWRKIKRLGLEQKGGPR